MATTIWHDHSLLTRHVQKFVLNTPPPAVSGHYLFIEQYVENNVSCVASEMPENGAEPDTNEKCVFHHPLKASVDSLRSSSAQRRHWKNC
jgi:3-hydroxy-3-methylglutaryl CoA synthase